MPRIRTIIAALLALIALIPLAFVFQPSAAGAQQGGVMVDTLFGEGQSGLKVVFFVIVVLVLLALAFWLLRRFGAGRLGGGAARGRQPRLAVIDQATVDGRRPLDATRLDVIRHDATQGRFPLKTAIVHGGTTRRGRDPLAGDRSRARVRVAVAIGCRRGESSRSALRRRSARWR